MAVAFKVRLDDGVEVGPLDAEMLRSWWQQGMVHRETRVRAPGSKSWRRLGDAMDVSDWGGVGGPNHGQAEESEDDAGPEVPAAWRTYAVSVLLFLIAGAAGYAAFFSSRLRPAFQGAPWREIALGQLALALLLVLGWEPMRKLVRVLVFILALSLFPLAAPVIVEGLGTGIDASALAALFSAWVLGSGLFFLLAGRSMSWKVVALCLFWIVLGAVGAAYFGLAPGPMLAAVR